MAKGFTGLAFMMILLLFGVVFGVYSKGLINDGERVVRLDGTFTLIDQDKLYRKVMQISSKHEDRKEFANAIQNELSKEGNISYVSVRYTWPEIAIVEVAEIIPIAIVNEHYWLTQECNKVIRDNLVGEDDLISIQMDKAISDNNACEKLKGLLKMLSQLNGVQNILVRSNGEYAIHYRGVEFIMNDERIESTLQRIKKLYSALDMEKLNVMYVDMRHIGGVSIALAETGT
jgi:cell division septal protein FtsQ